MAKVQHIDALKRIKMNFSTVGIRTPLKDYELAYWMNVQYGMQLVCRQDVVDEWDQGPYGNTTCLTVKTLMESLCA